MHFSGKEANDSDLTVVDLTTASFKKLEPLDISIYGYILDMALVAQNRLLLCTYNKLVLVDSQQDKVKFELNLMNQPGRVCIINKDCAAVKTSTYDNEKLQYMHYIKIKDDTLKPGERVRVSVSGCIKGICAMKDNLAVSYVYPPAVAIITKKGKVINRIGNDTAEREIFISPWYLTASSDYEHIFVSDHGTNTITMLNPDLQVLNTFSNQRLLNSTHGLSMWNDQVLVCGGASNNIVLLDPSSGRMSTILDEKDGIDRPGFLAFCHQTKTLFITPFFRNDNIQPYQLQ